MATRIEELMVAVSKRDSNLPSLLSMPKRFSKSPSRSETNCIRSSRSDKSCSKLIFSAVSEVISLLNEEDLFSSSRSFSFENCASLSK